MTRREVVWACVFVGLLWFAVREGLRQADRYATLTAQLATVTAQRDSALRAFRVDTVRVVEAVTRWRTLRDTLRLSDTVPVPVETVREIVRTCDSLAFACEAAKVSSGRVIRALTDERDLWKAKATPRKVLGLFPAPQVTAGVGACLNQGISPTVSAGWRIF